MRFTERQLLILTIIVPGVVAIVLGLYGYFISYKKLDKVQADIESVNNQIKAEENKLVQMATLDEKLAALMMEQESINEKLPSRTPEVLEDFLNTLVKIGQEAKILVQGINVSDESKKSGPPTPGVSSMFDKMSFTIKAEGDFFQCMGFIYLLESNKRFIRVERFSLRPTNLGEIGKKSVTTIKHSLDIRITTYSFNASQATPQK